MIIDSDYIDKNATIIVNLDKLSDSSLHIRICIYLTTDWVEYHEIKHSIMISILSIIENHGGSSFSDCHLTHIRKA